MADYLMAGQQSELERLQLQSRVWEPAGRALVERLPAGTGQRALDVGCGAMGWLRILGKWADPSGTVVGTDINRELLPAAEAFVAAEALSIVELVEDDLFASALTARWSDPGLACARGAGHRVLALPLALDGEAPPGERAVEGGGGDDGAAGVDPRPAAAGTRGNGANRRLAID